MLLRARRHGRKMQVGTGTFAMASRRVEITGNTYADNNTADIAVIGGLAIEQDMSRSDLADRDPRGSWNDLGLLPGAGANTVMNFRSNILISGNTHARSGLHPNVMDPLQLGLLLILSYAGQPVDSVLYDSIGEPMFDSTDPLKNTNVNHLCVGGNTNGTFSSMNLAEQWAANLNPVLPPGGAVRAVRLHGAGRGRSPRWCCPSMRTPRVFSGRVARGRAARGRGRGVRRRRRWRRWRRNMTKPVNVNIAGPPARLLSAYNLFTWDPEVGFTYNPVGDRVVPYDLNSPLFS